MQQKKRWKKISFIGLLSAICLALLSLAAIQIGNLDVPYVPTPMEVVEAMLAMAEVNKDDMVYDLGCGDGRIVITAAKMYGSRGIGIDIDPQRIIECNKNANTAGVEDRVEFFQADLFEADFSDASVLTLYLLTQTNLRLRYKFLKELNPGTRIVSHDYDMGKWRADNDVLIEDDWEIHSVYFWIVPANVTGTWTWSVPADSGKKNFALNLEQSFQYVSGEAFENKILMAIPISEGKVTGDMLVFTLERNSEKQIFEGRVQGHSIVGTIKTEGRENTIRWEAKRDPSTQVPLDSPIKDIYTLNQ